MLAIPKLEALLQSYVDAGHILGLAVAGVEGDGIAYAGGLGRARVDGDAPAATAETLFGVGSISKVILATAILRLVEAGALDLDAPVTGYLPGFSFSDPELGRRVTLRRLLSHTSGLPGAGKDWGPRDSHALERFAWDQLSRHAFVAEPGRVHLYSSTAITLAGYVAQVVAEKPYRRLVQETVFDPLGMERTTFDHAFAQTLPLALPHEEESDGSLRAVHRLADNVAGEPSGFALSTALDLAQLAIVHLNRSRFREGEGLGVREKTFHPPRSCRAMEPAAASRCTTPIAPTPCKEER